MPRPSDTPSTPDAANPYAATPDVATPGRSEGLLPADQSDPDLQVAEEVAFDLQSDEARAIGSMPTDTAVSKPGTAIAESLRPDQGPNSGR